MPQNKHKKTSKAYAVLQEAGCAGIHNLYIVLFDWITQLCGQECSPQKVTSCSEKEKV